MSMLAEPRRKEKWTLNPRGKHWSDDSNKFGQKMLEKMGWTSGKGLGAKEQGMTEHVRVALKTDNTGIGFKKDDQDKAWTEHQDSFNDFLQKLQTSQENTITQTVEVKTEALSGKSLELKSKRSRARVHYHKFTRGKDVNKYSSKDLANIFGQKELGVNSIKEEQSAEVEDCDPVGTQYNTGGVITINSGNMAEYFMKKGHNLFKSPKIERSNCSSDSESETEYVGFGFASAHAKKQSDEIGATKQTEITCNYAFENPCLRLNSAENVSDSSNAFQSSKKRKNKTFEDNEAGLSVRSKKLKEDSAVENNYENGFVNSALNLETQSAEVCNGKEFEVSRVQFGLANSALDLTDETEDKKRVTFNDQVEYSTDHMKKKKGKARLDKFEVENKKHKRKRKHPDSQKNSVPSGFVNEALDFEEVSEEINDNQVNERKSRKGKKRKESRRSNLETIVETPEEDKELFEGETEIDNIQVEENTLESSVPEESLSQKETKKKNRKKKEKVKEPPKDTADEEAAEEKKELDKNEENQNKGIKESKKKKKTSKNNDSVTERQQVENEVQKQKEEIDSKPQQKKMKKDKSDTFNVEIEGFLKEKEDNNKENTNGEPEVSTKTKKPKKSKHRKSVGQSRLNNDVIHDAEPAKQEPVEETGSTNTPSKKSETNEAFHRIRSPWNEKARMSKKLLKSLFHRNAVVNFPGSNIQEIKGYGADVE